jgi:NAD(P) transhydrogenase subunit beta
MWAAADASAVGSTPDRDSPWVWGAYLIAAALFILSLKWLSHPKSARRGVLAGEIGMAPGGVRQAAGDDSQHDQGIAVSERVELRVAGRGAGDVHLADVQPASRVCVRAAVGRGAGVRTVPGDADRRRRHADGDLAAQLVRRPRRRV